MTEKAKFSLGILKIVITETRNRDEKHDEIYRAIDDILKQQAQTVHRETLYVR